MTVSCRDKNAMKVLCNGKVQVQKNTSEFMHIQQKVCGKHWAYMECLRRSIKPWQSGFHDSTFIWFVIPQS